MTTDTFTVNIANTVNTFLAKLAEKAKLETGKVKELWDKHATIKAETKGKRSKADGPKCTYVYQKGNNPGKVCGANVCANSTLMCSSHLKYENATPKSKVPVGAKQLADSTTKPKPANKLYISMNNYGNHEHKPTGLVFNSSQKVYGKQVGEKVLALSPADVETCKKYGFKYLEEAKADPESKKPTEDEEVIEDAECEVECDDDNEDVEEQNDEELEEEEVDE